MNDIDDEFQTNERVSKRISDDSPDYSAAFHSQKRPNESHVGRTGGWWCQYYSPTIDREVCRVTFEMWRPLLTLDVGNTLLLAGLNQASSQANFVMQMKLFSPRYVRHHQPEMRQFQFRRCQLSGPKSFSARVHLDAKSSTAR